MSVEADVQMLVDRQAIMDQLHLYCQLVDQQRIDEMLEAIFSPQGSDDHGEGPVVGRAALSEWLHRAMANIAASAHNVSNAIVELNGDRASMRSTLTAWTWMRSDEPDGQLRPADYVLSLNYVDEWRKYPEGWRIDRRVLESNGVSVIAIGELPQTQESIHSLAARIRSSKASA